MGGDALSCQIVLFNLEETSVYNNDDMKIDVSMGCVKIVFLNWFVNSVLVSINKTIHAISFVKRPTTYVSICVIPNKKIEFPGQLSNGATSNC